MLLVAAVAGAQSVAVTQAQESWSEQFTPEPGSDRIFDDVVMHVMTNGARYVTFSIKSDAAEDSGRFYFIADPTTGLYRTFQLAVEDPMQDGRVAEYLAPLMDRIRMERDAIQRAGRTKIAWPPFRIAPQQHPTAPKKGVSPLDIVPPCNYCSNTCNGNAYTQIDTYDPDFAGYVLNRTASSTNWAREDGGVEGCVWRSNFAPPSCQAFSTPFSSWSTDSCWSVSAGGKAEVNEYTQLDVYGQYHDFQFGNPTLATWVDSSASAGYNGAPVHDYSWGAGGEFYFLLQGIASFAHINNCN